MLWAFFGVMALAALFAVVWPLYRTEQRFSPRAIGVAVLVLAVSAVLYQQIGTPTAQTVASAPPDAEAMVKSLADRLAANPNDVAGWKMLGRSYSVMRRYPESIAAFERAVALENSADGQTIVDLGEAVLMNDNSAMSGRAGELFESALAITPGNPKALFYSGLAAAERGDPMLAADRWDALLATSPPAEIESVLTERIAQWRGVMTESVGLTIGVSLAPAAEAVVNPDATVFVIARDPAQPSPPIAVARRRANELPISVTMTDSDAMIPGRVLSGFKQIEIITRVSASGQPIAQTGDWFGSSQIDTENTRDLSIVIDQQVP